MNNDAFLPVTPTLLLKCLQIDIDIEGLEKGTIHCDAWNMRTHMFINA
jgi:hypothetical protein